MSEKGGGAAVIGVAACAACCAGPLLGVVAAIGLGTITGVLLFGFGALALGGAALFVVVRYRQRTRPDGHARTSAVAGVPVELRTSPNLRIGAEHDA